MRRRTSSSTPSLRSLAHSGAVRRSCQTMARWIGSPLVRSHSDRRLALVGDADRRRCPARPVRSVRRLRAPSRACRARCPRRRARPIPEPGSAVRVRAAPAPPPGRVHRRRCCASRSCPGRWRGRVGDGSSIGAERNVRHRCPQSRAFLKPARSGNIRRVRAPIGLVVLLAVALLVNYVDRGSIAVAAPLLEIELRLSASEMGWVLAAFYWAYAPMQPVMGWCADRFGPARVLAGGFLLWSLATALAGFAGGLAALVALRLLMGVGEATFYPSALSLLSRNVAPAPACARDGDHAVRRACSGRRSARCSAGSSWSATAGGRCSSSWDSPRSSGCSSGGAGCAARRAQAQPRWPATIRRTRLILRQRALWGGMMGTFCSNYAFYFVFSWLPLYLVNERGLSVAEMAPMATAVLRGGRRERAADRVAARSLGVARRQPEPRLQDRARPRAAPASAFA